MRLGPLQWRLHGRIILQFHGFYLLQGSRQGTVRRAEVVTRIKSLAGYRCMEKRNELYPSLLKPYKSNIVEKCEQKLFAEINPKAM
jgi:hypothetical protein